MYAFNPLKILPDNLDVFEDLKSYHLAKEMQRKLASKFETDDVNAKEAAEAFEKLRSQMGKVSLREDVLFHVCVELAYSLLFSGKDLSHFVGLIYRPRCYNLVNETIISTNSSTLRKKSISLTRDHLVNRHSLSNYQNCSKECLNSQDFIQEASSFLKLLRVLLDSVDEKSNFVIESSSIASLVNFKQSWMRFCSGSLPLNVFSLLVLISDHVVVDDKVFAKLEAPALMYIALLKNQVPAPASFSLTETTGIFDGSFSSEDVELALSLWNPVGYYSLNDISKEVDFLHMLEIAEKV